jgi:TDG/mug DNA glycosylase family protein
MPYQPDILAKNLDVIFCGINPALTAAVAGYNFSHPSNRFWQVLHAAGFTDVLLNAKDERRLLDFRCGLSAVVARPTRRAAEVPAAEFRAVRQSFETKIRRYAPRAVAFLGKRAFCSMMGCPQVPWGKQQESLAGVVAWILPNPSGLNRSFTTAALVKAYAQLRRSLER